MLFDAMLQLPNVLATHINVVKNSRHLSANLLLRYTSREELQKQVGFPESSVARPHWNRCSVKQQCCWWSAEQIANWRLRSLASCSLAVLSRELKLSTRSSGWLAHDAEAGIMALPVYSPTPNAGCVSESKPKQKLPCCLPSPHDSHSHTNLLHLPTPLALNRRPKNPTYTTTTEPKTHQEIIFQTLSLTPKKTEKIFSKNESSPHSGILQKSNPSARNESGEWISLATREGREWEHSEMQDLKKIQNGLNSQGRPV
jgi:hypothetical protein